MGSKNRLAKHLLPIILKNRKPAQWYVEPFVGGANMIDKVDGNRIGADSNGYLIEALKLIRDRPSDIPTLITEADYQTIKNAKFLNGITGFTGFAMSFGGKWFGGYRRDVAGTKGCLDNMRTQTRRSRESAIKQSPLLQDVKFNTSSYQDLTIPYDSIIYCDPPYQSTTKYKDKFNHDEFWEWCREQVKEGHEVFISEYNAPDDFICVFKKEQVSSLTKNTGSKKGVECLFVHNSQHELSNDKNNGPQTGSDEPEMMV